MALLGGYFQQIYGSKNLLMVSAVPGFVSWVVLAAAPNSVPALFMSRLFAGLASGLLLGCIHAKNVAVSTSVG